MALSGARSVTYGGLLVTSSCPVAPVGQDLMTIHRTGTMSRRGAHARDTGSTTGIATAVLALLSAGTLASLGLVTADELRGGGSGNLSAPYNDLLPARRRRGDPHARAARPWLRPAGRRRRQPAGGRPVRARGRDRRRRRQRPHAGDLRPRGRPRRRRRPSLRRCPPVRRHRCSAHSTRRRRRACSRSSMASVPGTPTRPARRTRPRSSRARTAAIRAPWRRPPRPPASPSWAVTPAASGAKHARRSTGALRTPAPGPARPAHQPPVAATDPALPAAAPPR